MKTFSQLLAPALLLGAAAAAPAQTATQDVTIVVEEINEISVSGAVTLTINTATAGSAPTDATDNSSTYAITTNSGTNKKITGQLDGEYESGISLSVELAAPTGGTVSGSPVALNATSAEDLVTTISGVAEGSLAITYTAAATMAAVPNAVAGETQTVTFTVTDE